MVKGRYEPTQETVSQDSSFIEIVGSSLYSQRRGEEKGPRRNCCSGGWSLPSVSAKLAD